MFSLASLKLVAYWGFHNSQMKMMAVQTANHHWDVAN